MKLRVLSDLHTEFWNRNPVLLHETIPHLDTDRDTVLVIAGDLGLLHKPETWLHILKSLAPRFKAIVYVAGNHEFYHNNYFGRIDVIVKEVKLPDNVYFLENASVLIEDVTFIGSTLWTDMNFDEETMKLARRSMNDYNCMRKSLGLSVTPEDTVNAFRESYKYIFNTILEKRKENNNSKIVVVTHHLPSYQCVAEEFKDSPLNPAFATDMDLEILKYGPNLWISGHTHSSYDFNIGDTRLIANPYGYYYQDVNPNFNNKLVIEI